LNSFLTGLYGPLLFKALENSLFIPASKPLTLSIGPFWNTWGSSQTTQYSFNTGIRCSANSIVWEQGKWE